MTPLTGSLHSFLESVALASLCDRMAFLGVPEVAALAFRLDPPYKVG